MTDKELWNIVNSLSLAEKATLCSGADSWTTKAISTKGVPSLRTADGPHGVRREDRRKKITKQNGGNSYPATCFPPEVALASSWSTSLTHRIGAALAEECLSLGVGLLLAPGVNIKRSPLGGRNFEYYSEDPVLAGELAAGMINGTQSKGVGTSLKHFAVNNQEKFRMTINTAVDKRALFDIYLKPFEIAIKKAQPSTVMASYNRINGLYASENSELLTNILRMRFGFKGFVVSDWGAVNNRIAGIMAGLDLEMPSSHEANTAILINAVKGGRLSENALDAACCNILRVVFQYNRQGKQKTVCNFQKHHLLAVEALTKGAVLLKNDGILPLQKNQNTALAIIGEMADKPRFQGGGSSLINPMQLKSFLQAMKDYAQPFSYTAGYNNTKTSPTLLAAAREAATGASQVVLFLGLPDLYECEGYDRNHLRLPKSQLELLDTVCAENQNVTVVLCNGGPIEMPWLSKVRAVLCLHLGGEGLGEAAVKLLYGEENPSGKLAETWPLALEDTPAYHHFPMGPNEVSYNESIYIGYRYYDKSKKPVQFPFGFGLSYTKYAYSALTLSKKTLASGESLVVNLTVKNAGKLSGEEIVQVYVSNNTSAIYQPVKELKAFTRVALNAGEEKQVSLNIPYASLAFYDVNSGTDVVENGDYTLLVGTNSAEISLNANFSVQGITITANKANAASGIYGEISNNRFPTKNFALIYHRKLLSNRPPKKGEYTLTTPIGLMQDTAGGKFVFACAKAILLAGMRFSIDPLANKRAAYSAAFDLPLKNVILQSEGAISPRAAKALLDACNGKKLSMPRVLAEILATLPQKLKK